MFRIGTQSVTLTKGKRDRASRTSGWVDGWMQREEGLLLISLVAPLDRVTKDLLSFHVKRKIQTIMQLVDFTLRTMSAYNLKIGQL